ncbi:unnamed protein product [Lathyrus oleraceus]
MLVQFETPAGFALFKVLNEGKLSEVRDLSLDFSTVDAARKVVKLKAFSKFENNSSGLIDDSHDIKTSNNTNILGNLTLRIIKVSKRTQEVQTQDMAKLVGIRLKLMFKLCNLMKQINSVKWLLTFIEQIVQHHQSSAVVDKCFLISSLFTLSSPPFKLPVQFRIMLI